MKKIFYFILAVAAIVASCTKETISEPVSPSGDGSSVFTGTIIQPGGIDEATKVSIIDQTSTPGKVFIRWTSGDQIHIIKIGSDEWDSTSEDTKPKVFSAANSEATTDFSGTPPNGWIAPNERYSARYYGKNDIWKEYVLAGESVKGITIDCKSHADAAFLENMPLSCGESVYDSGKTRYNFTFSNAYAILQINVPSKLIFNDLYVCVNKDAHTQDVHFENGHRTEDSEYTLCLEDAHKVKETEKYTGKEYVSYFVPVSAGNYEKLTIVAAKENAEVARMETYVGNIKNGSDSQYALPQLYSNNIYPFDFCNTKTINEAGTYSLESNDGIDYKVNIAADIESDVTINAEVEGNEPANIYINNRGHQISGKLTINASKSHVEGENGIATEVEAHTSNSTFVVKPTLTITGLTVKKGSVVVEGTEDNKANVKTITIPSDVTEQIKIDVSGVSTATESDRVKIVNNSETPVVVVPDDVDDQKSYQVEKGEVTPVSKDIVAMIGTTGYETLKAAVDAVPVGNQSTVTIKVIKDIVLKKADALNINKNEVVLDGQGHTIALDETDTNLSTYLSSTFGQHKMITVSGENVTLRNLTLDGKNYRGASLAVTVNGKNVTYDNILYKGRGSGHYYGYAKGLVTFNKCIFDTHGYAVHFDGGHSSDDVVITDCKLNGWNSFGACSSLTISGSHFGAANDEGKNGWLAVIRPYCPTTITNCTFSKEYLTKDKYYGLTVRGNVVVALNGCSVEDGELCDIANITKPDDPWVAGGVIAIDATGNATDGFTAGTFVAKQASDIKAAAGAEVKPTGKDYVFTIAEGTDVAKIDNTGYPSLAAAIEAVGDGKTITLVKDVTNAAGIKVASGKNFTVDFGGHSYAMECPGAGSAATQTAGFQLLKNSTITFKNGTINCTEANKEKTWVKTDASKGIALMIQNYANLTLEDMTIDATNIAHNGVATRYALSNNSGNVEYKGATSIISAAGDYAFDVCKFDTYAEPKVTWNSTGSVNGVIELTGGEFIVAKDLKLYRPIRSNSNPAILTVNAGATVSPAQKFGTFETAFANANNEYKQFNEASSGVVIVNRGGNLTIKGGGTITSTSNDYCYAAVCLTEKGEATGADAKLTVEGTVTLEGYFFGIAGNGSRQGTDITIKGGTVKGIEANNCSGIYHPQNGKLRIEGGIIEGATGIYVKSGQVTAVTGGTIRGLGEKTTFEHENSGATVTGDAFIVENCGYPGGTPVVSITGGTFESKHASAVSSYGYDVNPKLTGFITGGTFNTQPAGDLIADGYKIKKVSDTEYTVSAIDANDVATINGLAYSDLATALSALKAGETLKIWKAGEYTVQTLSTPANTTVEGMAANRGVVFKHTAGASSWIANAAANGRTVKNITWNVGKAGKQALHLKNVIGCEIIGNFYPHEEPATFTECVFTAPGYEYCIETWNCAEATFKSCIFNTEGKAMNVYGANGTYTFEDCIFNAPIFSGKGKAAIFVKDGVDTDSGDMTVYIKSCTANYVRKYTELDPDDPSISADVLWNVEKGQYSASCDVKVYLDGTLVYTNDALVGISTPDQLKAFATAVNGGNTYSGLTVTLLNDLNLSGVEVSPIGTSTKKFWGSFDGNNKAISNLKISGSTNGVGLFGYVFGGGTIKDLTITGAEITNTATDYTGILVGHGGNVNVLNCNVNGTVKGPEQIGGVVGYLACGSIKNCEVNATVEATASRAGIIAGKANVDSGYKIEDNSAKGSVKSADLYAGGVVGQIMCSTNNTWTIKNNSIDATVSAGGSLIGNVRPTCWDAFVAGYQNNVTGNTWTASGDCTITDGTQDHTVTIAKSAN